MRTFLKVLWSGAKHFLVFIITFIVVVFLHLFIVTSALGQTILDREYMTDFASSRESYSVLTETVPQLIQYESDEGEEVTFNEVLQKNQADKFINKYFDYSFYEDASSEFISGVFNWLEGVSNKPDFEIAVAANEEEFVDLFADAYWLRISQMPDCESTQQISENIFELRCKPKELKVEDIKMFLNKNKNNPEFKEFMQSAIINGEDLELDENVQNFPVAFRLVKWSPLIFLALISVFIYLLYLIYFDRHQASNKVGKRIAISSGFISAVSLIIIFGHSALLSNLIDGNNQEELIANIIELSSVVVVDISQIALWISLSFVLLGLTLFEYGTNFFQRRFLDNQ